MPILQGLGEATGGLWKDYAVSDPNDNKWQRILDFMGQRLAEISIATGYKTDIGINVFYDRPTDLQDEECPGLVYSAENIAPTEGCIGSFSWSMQVNISIIANGTSARGTVNKAVTDILTVIKANRTWDNLATQTGQPTVAPQRTQQQDKIISGATVSVPITFNTDQWAI